LSYRHLEEMYANEAAAVFFDVVGQIEGFGHQFIAQV
jgi:hypothetical protein